VVENSPLDGEYYTTPMEPRPLFNRHLTPALEAAFQDTPVVLVTGPRQAGKTTLCRIAADQRRMQVLSLDDAATLSAATRDPAGFVAALDGPAMLDEIQKAPALLPAIKLAVDRRRQPGRFLLTGSADVLALPRVSESLAGRMEVLTLWPLSQGEIDGRAEDLVSELFSEGSPRHPGGVRRAELITRALRGGYPEILARKDSERRRAWFGSYVSTILQRDIRDLAHIEGLSELPRLLSLLAARSSSLLNLAELSRSLGLAHTSLTRYVALLEHTFLLRRIPAWAGNRAKRAVKASRVLIPDTGLLAHLAGLTVERMKDEPSVLGPLLESFVASELLKQLTWSRTPAALLHFRTHGGKEVDLVLERNDGRIVGIEVKAGATIGTADLRGLDALREVAGKRFHRGVVLYAGSETIPFGPDLTALPLAVLWNAGSGSRGRR
jgi:predicted AAA+ superfamily ATPase